MQATRMPRPASPKYGTLRSRANCAALILPSTPRSPKPPGTRIAVDVFEETSAPDLRSRTLPTRSQSRLTFTLLAMPPCDQRFGGAICRRPSCRAVLADNGDGDVAFRIADAVRWMVMPAAPDLAQPSASRTEGGQHFAVETAGVIGLSARRRCCRRSRASITAVSAHVAEQRQLAALAFVAISARSVRHSRMSGWMPIRTQLLDRVLRRLGLQFAGRSE